MLRIGLFLLTNIAVIAVASITLSLLGVGRYLDQSGNLDLQTLLIFCAVFGFTGSIISLLLSKFIAKKTMGVQLIERPRTTDEQWLVDTVADLAKSRHQNTGDRYLPRTGIQCLCDGLES